MQDYFLFHIFYLLFSMFLLFIFARNLKKSTHEQKTSIPFCSRVASVIQRL